MCKSANDWHLHIFKLKLHICTFSYFQISTAVFLTGTAFKQRQQ